MQALVDQNDSLERTALSLAAERGHAEVVELLVKAGANVEAPGTGGRTPISWAAWGGDAKAAMAGHAEIVDLLQI